MDCLIARDTDESRHFHHSTIKPQKILNFICLFWDNHNTSAPKPGGTHISVAYLYPAFLNKSKEEAQLRETESQLSAEGINGLCERGRERGVEKETKEEGLLQEADAETTSSVQKAEQFVPDLEATTELSYKLKTVTKHLY